jgi:hypothetical protein
VSTAVSLAGATETKWTVISGPMSGTVRLMTTSAFSIGRSPENEFVIVNDPKCSRKHATVQWTQRGCEVSAMSEANPVAVNGKEVERAVLKDGDVLTFGDTRIQFNLTTGGMDSVASSRASTGSGYTSGHTQIALVEPSGPPAGARSYAQPAVSRQQRPSGRGPRKKQSNKGRIYLYGGIALIGIVIYMLPNAKKKDLLQLRTEQKIEADIAEAGTLKDSEQKLLAPLKKLDESMTGRQAQENYVRGFRDFRKGQYERSLDSFQACLALDPGHSLCNRYLRLAQRKFNELVQYNIILGRKYREQNQYKNCRASFRNVMVMVKDANSAAYKEAKANFEACNSLAEGRF